MLQHATGMSAYEQKLVTNEVDLSSLEHESVACTLVSLACPHLSDVSFVSKHQMNRCSVCADAAARHTIRCSVE